MLDECDSRKAQQRQTAGRHSRAAGLPHGQPVRHDGFFAMCRRTAGGRAFWRRNRHTQKRMQSWIGDAYKRRLFHKARSRNVIPYMNPIAVHDIAVYSSRSLSTEYAREMRWTREQRRNELRET